MFNPDRSPFAGLRVVDRNSSRRQLTQQLRHGRRNLTVTWDGYRPFKVSSKFFSGYLPLLQSDRGYLSNLYEGPMPCEGQGCPAIRQWAAHNEVIASVDENTNHINSSVEPRIGYSAAHCEVINHLLREQLRISGQGSLCPGQHRCTLARG